MTQPNTPDPASRAAEHIHKHAHPRVGSVSDFAETIRAEYAGLTARAEAADELEHLRREVEPVARFMSVYDSGKGTYIPDDECIIEAVDTWGKTYRLTVGALRELAVTYYAYRALSRPPLTAETQAEGRQASE